MLGWYSLSPDEETLGPSAHVSSFFFPSLSSMLAIYFASSHDLFLHISCHI